MSDQIQWTNKFVCYISRIFQLKTYLDLNPHIFALVDVGLINPPQFCLNHQEFFVLMLPTCMSILEENGRKEWKKMVASLCLAIKKCLEYKHKGSFYGF